MSGALQSGFFPLFSLALHLVGGVVVPVKSALLSSIEGKPKIDQADHNQLPEICHLNILDYMQQSQPLQNFIDGAIAEPELTNLSASVRKTFCGLVKKPASGLHGHESSKQDGALLASIV